MSYWSKNAARMFVENRNAKRVADTRVIHDRNMIELKSPSIWSEVSQSFAPKCSEFNAEPDAGNILSFDAANPNKIVINRNDTRSNMTVTFSPKFSTITIGGFKEPLEFKFEVLPGTSEVSLFHPKEGQTTPGPLDWRCTCAIPGSELMPKSKKPMAKPSAKRGPKPGRLKLEGDWRDAIRKSLTKKKPPEGWPK